MNSQRSQHCSRREFASGLTLAAGASVLGLRSERAEAEPRPETTRLRLIHDPESATLCYAPQYVAQELLRGEGFTDLRYVKMIEGSETKTLAAGQADLSAAFAGDLILAIDGGTPLVVLSGLHGGCLELVGTKRIRTIRDLKGQRVAVSALGAAEHTLLASILAYVGLDPRKDVHWVVKSNPADSIRLLAEGKIDALFAYPPAPQEMRAKKIGHVILSTATDPPWSQYFCCMVGARREFVQQHPTATKRAMRAILKANQVCAIEPARSARLLVDKGFTPNYDYALQTLREVRYDNWREYDPEATLRFHALRMRETGMISNTPQKIIAEGTDWRFLNELKRELKG